jgi:ferredoxin
MLYIDPDECIGCDACIGECPVEAIYRDADVPSRWTQYVQLNAERVLALKQIDGTNITQKQQPREGPGCNKR